MVRVGGDRWEGDRLEGFQAGEAGFGEAAVEYKREAAVAAADLA